MLFEVSVCGWWSNARAVRCTSVTPLWASRSGCLWLAVQHKLHRCLSAPPPFMRTVVCPLCVMLMERGCDCCLLPPVLRIGCPCADSGVQDAPTAADPQGPEGGSPWYAPMLAGGHDARMQTGGLIDRMAGESVVVASKLSPIRLAHTASFAAASLLFPSRLQRPATKRC